MVLLALCILSILEFTNSFILYSETAPILDKRSIFRVSYKECNQNITDRLDCGHNRISEEQCNARECCWSTDEGGPRCYYAKSTIGRSCALESQDKVKCGGEGIRKEQCLALDCCWQPSGDGPWCYEEILPPIYTGECGKSATAPQMRNWRILGGDEATPHSWPWIVSLQRRGWHMCGGTVLNERWILSAAHCAFAFEILSNDSLVVAGAHNKAEDEPSVVKVMMDEIITYNEYFNSQFESRAKDVLLIRLAEPLEFNDFISPVCTMQERPLPGRNCYSVGWGMDEMYITEDNQWEWGSPDELQQVLAPIVDLETCNSTDWYFGRIPPTSICAGWEEGGRGNCYGDSGGPLMCFDEDSETWQQAGIVSWSWKPCATALKPAVYASVADNIEWVKEQLAEYD